MQISIRQLMIAIALVAIAFPISSFCESWRERYIDDEFPEIRTLENLRKLTNGEKLSFVKTQFSNLRFVEHQEFSSVPNQKIAPHDKCCFVPIDLSSAQWMHFRDNKLINDSRPTMNVSTEAASLNLPRPPWCISFGQWIIYAVILGIVFAFAYVRTRGHKPIGQNGE